MWQINPQRDWLWSELSIVFFLTLGVPILSLKQAELWTSNLWQIDHGKYKPIYDKCSAVAEMGDSLATINMGRKEWLLCPFRGRGAGSPSSTMSPGLRPTSIPSGILIHAAVWPHQRHRQTGQRSDSIGRTVLQTIAQRTTFTKDMWS